MDYCVIFQLFWIFLCERNFVCLMHSKMGIQDYERHLVLKYCSGLHRYIQTYMNFLDISSLGIVYRYVVKIEEKFK
jgi:hypothetical protein